MLGASGHFVGAALIVFVLAFFLLAFSDTLLNQAVESRPSFAQKRHVVSLLQNVETGISQYLATITIINHLPGRGRTGSPSGFSVCRIQCSGASSP